MVSRTVLILALLISAIGIANALEVAVPMSPEAPARAWRLVDSRQELRRMGVGPESRFVLPPRRVRFDLTDVEEGTIRTAFGVAASAWSRGVEEVEFTIKVRSEGKVYSSLLGRLTEERAERWRDLSLTVPPPTGQRMELFLEARSLRGAQLRPREILWTPPVITPRPVTSGTNIILVSIDTLRADHLGAYGYGRETSPNIDRLAREGILFQNAIATSSWTLPSHASMFTGFDPQRIGAAYFRLVGGGIRATYDTLPELLWDHFYETAGFTGGGFVSSLFGFDQGFDRFRMQVGTLMGHDEYFERSLRGSMVWLSGGFHRPFFLFLHTYAVHAPYDPPRRPEYTFDPAYTGPYAYELTWHDMVALIRGNDRWEPRVVEHLAALYDGEIREMDDTLGELIDYLRKTGLAKSTCVVVTSDHGDEFGEHGGLFHARAKLYEELIRVPLIVWCPSLYAGGRVVEEPVSIRDIMPTLLDMANVPIPPGLDGHSLLPVLKNGKTPVGAEVPSYVHKSIKNLRELLKPADQRSEDWNPVKGNEDDAVMSVRSSQYKLIRDLRKGRGVLFDLHADPAETKDVWAAHPDVVEQLNAVLDAAAHEAPTPSKLEATPDPATLERLRSLGYAK